MKSITKDASAINQVTRSLACEWAKDNIRVNAVAPWIINTPMIEAACIRSRILFFEMFGANIGLQQVPSRKENTESLIVLKIARLYFQQIGRAPMKQAGETSKVSSLVIYLCLTTASCITGQIICVDGAFTVNGFV
ncbi:tropinone reductase homolog [Lycium ferocissimum]|uniref:tropinone reductase homolog n=1 Tax=Lycium ferocissimum TaxID=112874 RepID=UPI0028150349|nr:tropinone reductase homolog [Lycium ferocissimum]